MDLLVVKSNHNNEWLIVEDEKVTRVLYEEEAARSYIKLHPFEKEVIEQLRELRFQTQTRFKDVKSFIVSILVELEKEGTDKNPEDSKYDGPVCKCNSEPGGLCKHCQKQELNVDLGLMATLKSNLHACDCISGRNPETCTQCKEDMTLLEHLSEKLESKRQKIEGCLKNLAKCDCREAAQMCEDCAADKQLITELIRNQ